MQVMLLNWLITTLLSISSSTVLLSISSLIVAFHCLLFTFCLCGVVRRKCRCIRVLTILVSWCTSWQEPISAAKRNLWAPGHGNVLSLLLLAVYLDGFLSEQSNIVIGSCCWCYVCYADDCFLGPVAICSMNDAGYLLFACMTKDFKRKANLAFCTFKCVDPLVKTFLIKLYCLYIP